MRILRKQLNIIKSVKMFCVCLDFIELKPLPISTLLMHNFQENLFYEKKVMQEKQTLFIL